MNEDKIIIEDRIEFLHNQMETMVDDVRKLQEEVAKKINESILMEKDVDAMSYVLYCGNEKRIHVLAEKIRKEE